MRRQFFTVIGLLALLCVQSVQSAAVSHDETALPNVIVTIKPLAHLVVELVAGSDIAPPEILYPAGENLHDYVLKVSDLKRLNDADVVLGFGTEQGLEKLQNKLGDKRWMSLGVKAAHSWLDPFLQASLFTSLAEQLVEIYPDKEALIRHNLSALILAIDAELESQVHGKGEVLAQHSAFNAWLKVLGVKSVLYTQGHSHGHVHQGVKEKLDVQALLAQGRLLCAIEEPDTQLYKLKKKFPALELVQLSPMRQALPLKPGFWVKAWQQDFAKLSSCLNKES